MGSGVALWNRQTVQQGLPVAGGVKDPVYRDESPPFLINDHEGLLEYAPQLSSVAHFKQRPAIRELRKRQAPVLDAPQDFPGCSRIPCVKMEKKSTEIALCVLRESDLHSAASRADLSSTSARSSANTCSAGTSRP